LHDFLTPGRQIITLLQLTFLFVKTRFSSSFFALFPGPARISPANSFQIVAFHAQFEPFATRQIQPDNLLSSFATFFSGLGY